jgi:hypothetical protein
MGQNIPGISLGVLPWYHGIKGVKIAPGNGLGRGEMMADHLFQRCIKAGMSVRPCDLNI